MVNPHYSVLLSEVVDAFASTEIKVFLDGTTGAGGHAQAILESHPEIERYIGIDQDPQALLIAAERLQPWRHKICLRQCNFSEFNLLLKELGISQVNGMLVDLGVSSMQLDQAERGFSFSREGPLDMRMDPTSSLTAAEIVNTWSEKELGRIFREYGEEKQWRTAAHAIKVAREEQSIMTTAQLSVVLQPVLYRNYKKGINPLTLIFQALRICTNQELERLEQFMSKAFDFLAPKGRLAVISFHSLEDRIVKTRIRFEASDKWDTSGIGGVFRDKNPSVIDITKKPIVPQEKEIEANPRSRSGKLRVAEKI
ncbi:MAG: 16S rRNA (cytosine(1402)-N(4))-methyltransferase RsmH [Chlamydiales bacterium]